MGHLHGVFLEWQKLPIENEWPLDEQESSAKAHIKALRLKNSDRLIFLDGKGHLLEAEILDSKAMRFKTLGIRSKAPAAPMVDVFLSPPKGDDLERSLQICVELGVRRLYLFHSDHCSQASAPSLGRLVRIAQASCEQSLNAWLPEIHNVYDKNLATLLRDTQTDSHALVFDESLADENAKLFRPSTRTQHYSVFVGPEGGWSESERHLFSEHRIERASLGSIVLKVATALCVGLSVLRANHES